MNDSLTTKAYEDLAATYSEDWNAHLALTCRSHTSADSEFATDIKTWRYNAPGLVWNCVAMTL
jgi:hypothetical protein